MPLYKRPGSPFWQVRIGRKARQSTGTEDYEEAREFERVLAQRIWRRDKLGERGSVSFNEAAARWLTDSSRPKHRDREILEWLAPKLGPSSVQEVADPDALEQIRAHGLAEGWSHSTVDRAMGTVSAILHACVGWRYIDVAPAIPMYRPTRAEPRWLTPAEFERLCDELPMHLALAARVAVNTLLRMRAMLKLTWDRVDLKSGKAWVPLEHQKTRRTFGLPLTAETIRVFRALRWLSPPKQPFVFVWQGKPIDDCNTLAFQEAVKRAGLAPLRWHDLRHTGASWAVQSGVTLPELMLLGDWRDYRSVLRYAHLAPTQAASAANKVAQWAHSESGREMAGKRRNARN
jgi:integrase